MIYDIYHDECKEGGFWHGFLFVPAKTRAELLALLTQARTTVSYFQRLHYVELGKQLKPDHHKYVIAQAWTSIGVAALQQRKLTNNPPHVFIGRAARRNSGPVYRVLNTLLKCKFVLFCERDAHQKMFAGMNRLKRIETTFRMAIKGGLHRLFSNEEQIEIRNVFMDGEEHYTGMYGRRFDVSGTLMRLAYESRPYVTFAQEPKLVPQCSDHSKIDHSQSEDDSHLLQLCDVLIGGFRFHARSGDRRHPRHQISYPCRELLGHDQANLPRMANSRYHRGFSLAEAWIEGNEWNFTPMRPAWNEKAPASQSALFGDSALAG